MSEKEREAILSVEGGQISAPSEGATLIYEKKELIGERRGAE